MQINLTNNAADYQPGKFAEKSAGSSNAKSKEVNISKETEKQPAQEAVVKNLPETKSSAISNNTNLNFSRDDETNQIVVELVDNKTGEIVRQVPTEVSLKLAAIFAQTQGNLIDKEF